jgi:hypothetical protein
MICSLNRTAKNVNEQKNSHFASNSQFSFKF